MIRPITYTYKGRPLAPFGTQKSARTLRRRKAIRSALLTGFCVLVVLAVASALGWWLSSCFQSDGTPVEGSNVPADTTALTAEKQTEESRAEAEPREETAVSEIPATRPETPPALLSESADRQALRIYSAAAAAFQKKDYESARKALRLFFEKLQVPPGHPLYDRACAMLSDSSLAVYRSGSDPSAWKVHKVERGENLSRIARKYGTDVQTITEVNQLTGTSLRIGQSLRIPQGSWRIRIERKNRRLLLDNSGRLFKIYPIVIGPGGDSAGTGIYRIRRQQTPDRILLYGGSASTPAAVIRSQGEDTENGRASFSMKPADLAELLILIPEKTPAEILK